MIEHSARSTRFVILKQSLRAPLTGRPSLL
jgi:hypothetical protein